jgi:hypothetical protein
MERLIYKTYIVCNMDNIPLEVLKDRKVSVLEGIVEYMKKQGLSFHEIGVLLNRDERNIWTVYNRATKKRKTGCGNNNPLVDGKINKPEQKSISIYGVSLID